MNKTELLNEAKKAKSLEELTQMAADVGNPLTEEEAKFYFSLVNQKEGDLSLEELDTVTGGAGTGDDAGAGSGEPSLAHCKNWHCFSCGTYAQGKDSCTCGCSKGGIMTSCVFCANRTSPTSDSHCSKYVDDGTGSSC
ncbi:MAG: hypothetical protein RSF88_05065 [Lachnospiraceae bacterium]